MSTHRRTPDGEARRQQRIQFDEEDREQAAHEAGFEYDDFKPFDIEP